MSTSRAADKFVVRLPDGMRGALADAAFERRRSMNSEIVHRLEQSLALASELADMKAVNRVLLMRIAELEARVESEK